MLYCRAVEVLYRENFEIYSIKSDSLQVQLQYNV